MNTTSTLALSSSVSVDIPLDILCPLTKSIMRSPVVAADGFSYEHTALQKWFSENKKVSPTTSLPMNQTPLIPNRTLALRISQWKTQEEKILEQQQPQQPQQPQQKVQHQQEEKEEDAEENIVIDNNIRKQLPGRSLTLPNDPQMEEDVEYHRLIENANAPIFGIDIK